jgi:transcription elongation factor GreA
MAEEYLTQERLDELKARLVKYKTEKRKEVAKRLKRAKELGDLSENSEYQEAREEQQRVERRIIELENLVRNAAVITKSSLGKVMIGSTVKAKKDDIEVTLMIVGPNEARPEEGRISYASPIGQAFLEKVVGDTVVVETRVGKKTYVILSIE